MNQCIEAISKYIPPHNSGYHFIKRAVVYIPFREVGLSILERKESALSLTYETILKLIEQGVNDIEQMSILLGLDISISKEIIAQMAIEDLLNVSGMSMLLSSKGKTTLRDLTKITTAKSQINRIFTNLITGEIETEENNHFWDRPVPNCMCLDQRIKVDDQFFRDHFENIESIYNKENSEEFDFSIRIINRETLYRILDIVYQETKYLATSCFVYINEEDSTLMFSFDHDKDSIYATTAMAEISKHVSGAMGLFCENNVHLVTPEFSYSESKTQALNELIEMMEKRKKSTVSTEKIEASYYTDRYLLDGESRDILMSLNEYNPSNIVICSANIKNFVQDNSFIDILLSLNYSTEITFIYNADEHAAETSVNWLLSRATGKDKKRLFFHPLDSKNSINKSIIISDPGFVLNTSFEKVRENSGSYLLKETTDISFRADKIAEAIKWVQQLLSNAMMQA